MISLAVFFTSISIKIQALTALLTLIVFLVLQFTYRPYSHDILNEMEMRAIVCAIVYYIQR